MIVTLNKYKKAPVKNSWKMLSSYDKIKLGYLPIIGKKVSIGTDTMCGDHFTVHDGCDIGCECEIGNWVVIGHNVVIRSNCIIDSNADIHRNSIIRCGAILDSNVTIGEDNDIGQYVKIGNNSFLNDNVHIGWDTNISNNIVIGSHTTIGNECHIGYDTIIGSNVIIGDNVVIGEHCRIKDNTRFTSNTKIGNDVVVLKESSTSKLNEYFIACLPAKGIYWKWVKKIGNKYFSPAWGLASQIEYPIGKVVIANTDGVSDKQCAEGLHVFRPGIRPEFARLNTERDELACLEVEVQRKHVCFGGLPGNDMKLRVSQLKVLREINPPKY